MLTFDIQRTGQELSGFFLVLQIISIRQLDLEIHKENCTSAISISCREVLTKSKAYSGRCWKHGDYKDLKY